MRLEEFMGTLQPNEIAVVTLNDRPMRAILDADDQEGWVEIPNLAAMTVASVPLPNPFSDGEAPETEVHTKKLTGKVEFKKVRREKKE